MSITDTPDLNSFPTSPIFSSTGFFKIILQSRGFVSAILSAIFSFYSGSLERATLLPALPAVPRCPQPKGPFCHALTIADQKDRGLRERESTGGGTPWDTPWNTVDWLTKCLCSIRSTKALSVFPFPLKYVAVQELQDFLIVRHFANLPHWMTLINILFTPEL